MTTTRQIFELRKAEIEICYSILRDLKLDDQPSGRTITINFVHTEKFAPILKSNILLMLYNLVEACVTSGFIEIYDSIKDSELAYKDLVSEIRNIWSNYEISKSNNSTATRRTYEMKVQEIIATVISNSSIELTKAALSISGNLDAKSIRQLLDNHNIAVSDRSEKLNVLLVKNKRNSLAHGLDSFGDCARDISTAQLLIIKNEVLDFINDVICCMALYYNSQLFRIHAETSSI